MLMFQGSVSQSGSECTNQASGNVSPKSDSGLYHKQTSDNGERLEIRHRTANQTQEAEPNRSCDMYLEPIVSIVGEFVFCFQLFSWFAAYYFCVFFSC